MFNEQSLLCMNMCIYSVSKSVTWWTSLQQSNFQCCGQNKQAGTSSIHNYIEACPLQYMANHPCDPIKKHKSRPAFPAIPGVWSENNCRARGISAQTQNQHFHFVFRVLHTEKRHKQWLYQGLARLDDAYCIYANLCWPEMKSFLIRALSGWCFYLKKKKIVFTVQSIIENGDFMARVLLTDPSFFPFLLEPQATFLFPVHIYAMCYARPCWKAC